ncbi:quinone-dependent dihydroorotate dehydrogenase [Hyphococcus flavus]|uniref:Dihydroorotate dehydrogenase (quinone) n=1 Tax=Hyphococcus flavus TaxID=1866326 RepID=A0AAF0CH89_9PROT|nr:quinone-dependent dihydroorotate dehydrogenase [Hyphococcus flavus]WDI33163.1 quinone-dependent dihydroorotate dehydrogenase [Hyphococcus flavus]
MKPPMLLADIGSKAMGLFDGETAHRLTVRMLKAGFGPKAAPQDFLLPTQVAGIDFPNPLGLAAGFDKNGEAPNAVLDLGFGFVEIGAVTPRPQPGNDRPRVFRLRADAAVINRYGFNNDGLDAVAARLNLRERVGVVGANLGANKDSEDRTQDYVTGIKGLAGLVDFFTVNISSPNTPGLRALQDKASLRALMVRVLSTRDRHAPGIPVFLKIAPDLTDEDKADIASIANDIELDCLIVSNTTITRPDTLSSAAASETGGLSGAPLFAPSTALLREFYREIGTKVPLIGVGGVFTARDTYEKIISGASLVQLYTALIYDGPSLPSRILRDLPQFLKADGFETISQAVGAGAN